jgi:hypothetical protein
MSSSQTASFFETSLRELSLTVLFTVPPELLRSALRELLSQGSVTQKPFVQHIRERFAGKVSAGTPIHDQRNLGMSKL